MKTILFLSLFILLFGCNDVQQMVNTSALTQNSQDKSFHTKIQRFEEELRSVKTKEERNKVVDALVNASDMECSTYQYNMSQESEEKTNTIYTYLFKKAGQYIGWDIAKDAIAAVSSMTDAGTEANNKEKYTQALKPNIIKAVQIARKKYLHKIEQHKQLDLQAYSVNDVKKDLENYDKRCSTYYGLLEITNALQKQEQSAAQTKNIDVDAVKNKIKEVTQEVKQEKNVDVNDTKPLPLKNSEAPTTPEKQTK